MHRRSWSEYLKGNNAGDTQEWYEGDTQMDLEKYFVKVWTRLNHQFP